MRPFSPYHKEVEGEITARDWQVTLLDMARDALKSVADGRVLDEMDEHSFFDNEMWSIGEKAELEDQASQNKSGKPPRTPERMVLATVDGEQVQATILVHDNRNESHQPNNNIELRFRENISEGTSFDLDLKELAERAGLKQQKTVALGNRVEAKQYLLSISEDVKNLDRNTLLPGAEDFKTLSFHPNDTRNVLSAIAHQRLEQSGLPPGAIGPRVRGDVG